LLRDRRDEIGSAAVVVFLIILGSAKLAAQATATLPEFSMPAHLKGLSRGRGALHVTTHVRKWRGEVEATRIRW